MTPHEKKKALNELVTEGAVTRAAILGAQDQDKSMMEYRKEAVRQAVIRAVPSVMELKMGCEVRIFESEKKWLVVCLENDSIKTLSGNSTQNTHISDITEIIGRPITLADVLVAIDSTNIVIDAKGEFVKFVNPDAPDDTGIFWDLSQDFDHQSEEFYQFAWELLVENK